MEQEINNLIAKLDGHNLYSNINSKNKLQHFMQRHIFAVYDFMSLAKSLQMQFAPSCEVWVPPMDNELSRFINEIILCEESDETPDGRVMSHFEMYCYAMKEVGADDSLAKKLIQGVKNYGVLEAIEKLDIPKSAKKFMKFTFDLVLNGKIHEIAASFCYGREKAIPTMFQSLLNEMNISKADAPMFHFYLERHIEVDGGSHGELAIKMLEILCGDDQIKWIEAKTAAKRSLEARIEFWNDVLFEINHLEVDNYQASYKLSAPAI